MHHKDAVDDSWCGGEGDKEERVPDTSASPVPNTTVRFFFFLIPFLVVLI